MEQLELDLWPQLYDVSTDMMRAARQSDINDLQAVYWAYGQIRLAVLHAQDTGDEALPVIVFNTIHTELKRRLHVPS